MRPLEEDGGGGGGDGGGGDGGKEDGDGGGGDQGGGSSQGTTPNRDPGGDPPGSDGGVCTDPLIGNSPYENQSPVSGSDGSTSLNDRSSGWVDPNAPLDSSNSGGNSASPWDSNPQTPSPYTLLDPGQDLTKAFAQDIDGLEEAMKLTPGEALFMAVTGQVSITDWLKDEATDLGVAATAALAAALVVGAPAGAAAITIGDAALIALPDLAVTFETATSAFELTKAGEEVMNFFSEMNTRAAGLQGLLDAMLPSRNGDPSESGQLPQPRPGPTPDLNYTTGHILQ